MDKLYRKNGTDIVYMGVPLEDSVEISQEEFDEVMSRNNKKRIRGVRDEKIMEIEWRVRRYQDEEILGLPHTDDIVMLAQYTQALRDVPQQPGFPDDVVWPILDEA